ncbi:D-sedoheptulose 7-phosphate isomerase [Methylomonas sp. MgM2]
MTFVNSRITSHIDTVNQLFQIVPQITEISELLASILQNNGRIYWIGNGGSAADCQHLAAELVGRFEQERKGLPSIALTTDSSIITALSNDYGYDDVFSRQVSALCTQQDVLIGITTSGNSKNILNAIRVAKAIGTKTIGLTGRNGGELKHLADRCIVVPSDNTARIQEAHILIGHIICDYVEQSLFKA